MMMIFFYFFWLVITLQSVLWPKLLVVVYILEYDNIMTKLTIILLNPQHNPIFLTQRELLLVFLLFALDSTKTITRTLWTTYQLYLHLPSPTCERWWKVYWKVYILEIWTSCKTQRGKVHTYVFNSVKVFTIYMGLTFYLTSVWQSPKWKIAYVPLDPVGSEREEVVYSYPRLFSLSLCGSMLGLPGVW